MKYAEGEEVLAKQPNTNEFMEGIILSSQGEKYLIQFIDGMDHSVEEGDVKLLQRPSRSTSKSRGRPKKSLSRASPTRKSPSRHSPSRRRSPSRKSPSRLSPGRSPSSKSKKLLVRDMKIAQVSLPYTEGLKSDVRVEGSKTDVQSLKNTDDVTEMIPLQSRLREPTAVTRRSTRIFTNMMKNEREQKILSVTRSVDRAVSLPVDRRAHVYDFMAEQRERGLSMQRERGLSMQGERGLSMQRERGLSMQREQDLSKILDYEEEALPDSSTTSERSKKEIELVSKPQEWGGWIGALCLIFVLPIAIILPQIACFNSQCNSAQFRISTKWESYINLWTIALYSGFLCSLAAISVLPIGGLIYGQENKTGRLLYRTNGIISALLMVTILAISEFNGYKISDFILDSCLQFSVAGWIIGTFLATGLYLKAGKMSVASLNMYASTNNIIYDFWQGREINPRIGPLDIKLVLLRAGTIGTLILNSAVVAKSIEKANSSAIADLDSTVLVAASLQIFYCLDSLVFESTILTSFKIMYEGTGYMVTVENLLYPFLLTLGTRFLLYQQIHQSSYVLATVVTCFLFGYIIYRVSNSQKNEFRKNPFSSALSHLESIPTSRGKRIITSGLWGHVRHPNYLGDIIIHWSMACIALTKDLLPYYAALCCTLALVYRAIRDDTRCRNRYGSDWEQYCLRVKSIILNRVF